MRLYYSGAASFRTQQTKAYLSLGGWISNTPIPNSLVGNVFGDISLMTIENKNAEYRLIVLRNDLLVAVSNILLHFVYPATYPFCKYEVAIVQPSGEPNAYYFENVDSIYSAPFYITGWSEADGQVNEINIGNLASGAYLGIWMKRTILPAVDGYYTDAAIIANYKSSTPVTIPTTDLTELKLAWT